MQYFQCQCGKIKSWTNMGPSPCVLCSECKTTLGQHPDDHKTEAEPHDWYEEESTTKWRGDVTHKHTRKCLNCGLVEKLPIKGQTE